MLHIRTTGCLILVSSQREEQVYAERMVPDPKLIESDIFKKLIKKKY